MAALALLLLVTLGKNVQIDSLQDHVYVVQQVKDPYQANSLLVVNGDDFILVDSKNNEADAALIWNWMKKQNKNAKLTVINSHFHRDSTGSNAYYKKQGAKVIASDRTNELLDQHGFGKLKANDTYPLKQSPALTVGKELVEIIYPGASHAPDDVVVYFPDRHVLFGSCMTKPGNDLGYLGDADLKSWRQAMDKVQTIPAKYVIPGHGTEFSPANVTNTIKLLDAALAKKS